MVPKIAPSLLSCDFSKLDQEIKAVEAAGADFIHVDVMDGHFVDNITLGPPIISSIRKCTKLPFDVHLMIENPENFLEAFIKAGADILTVHIEALKDPVSVIKSIKSKGVRPGITLRPGTGFKTIEEYLPLVDLVLIMTVEPGWGGQSFLSDQLEKVRFVKAWAEKNNPKLLIEVDGGINKDTAKLAVAAGASVLVAGSYIFRGHGGDYSRGIESLRAKV